MVRSHLRAAAPLPKAEYLALKQSVLELTALGRNLNQIARAMHQGGRPALPGRAEVGAILEVAEGLRDHFKGLLKANELSWRGHEKILLTSGPAGWLDIGTHAQRGPGRRDQLSPAEIDIITRTVHRTPEVMVKVLNRGGQTSER